MSSFYFHYRFAFSFFILQATFINSLPWDSIHSLDVDDSAYQSTNYETPSLIVSNSPDLTLFTSEPSDYQVAANFEAAPIEDGNLFPLDDPYLLQVPDSQLISFDNDPVATQNGGGSPSDQNLLDPIGDTLAVANLRLDIWNFWPWSCAKLNLQASCCTGVEDDYSVRHGCARVFLNRNCDNRSHRYCCSIWDISEEGRTWCVYPLPDGESPSSEDA